MHYLLAMATLLLIVPPQTHYQKLPAEFYQIPEQIRERATIIVSGTYGQGRTPFFFRPDGTRVWFFDELIQNGSFVFLSGSLVDGCHLSCNRSSFIHR